jgi:hypothetical protein
MSRARHSAARAQPASPDSIAMFEENGFRVRATQVGYSGLGRYESPISGRPEIGGAPRNDESGDRP